MVQQSIPMKQPHISACIYDTMSAERIQGGGAHSSGKNLTRRRPSCHAEEGDLALIGYWIQSYIRCL